MWNIAHVLFVTQDNYRLPSTPDQIGLIGSDSDVALAKFLILNNFTPREQLSPMIYRAPFARALDLIIAIGEPTQACNAIIAAPDQTNMDSVLNFRTALHKVFRDFSKK